MGGYNFFCAGTGCRVSTLINVKIGDIDWENRLIAYAHTKNRKAQFVPMSNELGKVLKEYLVERKGKPDDFLFPSEDNTQLFPSSIYHDIQKYNNSRGVKKCSLHLFRHTFAKNWILQGGDLVKLQKELGHSNIAMVQKCANTIPPRV